MKKSNLNNNYENEEKKDERPLEIAFNSIKRMMYNHEIVPGQKLLYKELAKKLNMSSTPIIQALNRLELTNIVYYERNKGFYVGEVNPREVKGLFDAIEALIIYLIPAIVEKMTHQKIRAINAIMKEHIKKLSVPQYRKFLMIRDAQFHLEIIKCADNKVIYNVCKLLFEQIYLKYRPEYIQRRRIKESAKEHTMFLEAIKEGNIAKTRRIFRMHIDKTRKHFISSLSEHQNFEI